jgi:hypothetical protein
MITSDIIVGFLLFAVIMFVVIIALVFSSRPSYLEEEENEADEIDRVPYQQEWGYPRYPKDEEK